MRHLLDRLQRRDLRPAQGAGHRERLLRVQAADALIDGPPVDGSAADDQVADRVRVGSALLYAFDELA